jgi:hypothetical protein
MRVSVDIEKLIEATAERVVGKAMAELKKDSPCAVHEKKLVEIEVTLKGNNGDGLITKVEDMIKAWRKFDGFWWKVAIMVGAGVGINKGVSIMTGFLK